MHGSRYSYEGEYSHGSNYKYLFFNTFWEKNEELPSIQIDWLRDNSDIYSAIITNGEQDIRRTKKSIDYLNKRLIDSLSEQKKLEQKIDREEKELSKLDGCIKNI